MRNVRLVSGIPLVCIRSQRRVLGFEVRTLRLYPSQVQVYPGKYQRSFARLKSLSYDLFVLSNVSNLLTKCIGHECGSLYV